MRPLKERPQNAVEKRNITSARLDQLQDDNTTETELFNAPPVAAEVIVTAVMEGENTVSHVRSRKLPGIAAKSSVVNHDHSYMSEEKKAGKDLNLLTYPHKQISQERALNSCSGKPER